MHYSAFSNNVADNFHGGRLTTASLDGGRAMSDCHSKFIIQNSFIINEIFSHHTNQPNGNESQCSDSTQSLL
jgi:hypothetical protein